MTWYFKGLSTAGPIPYREWLEQAIDEGATLYVERARLKHSGDLPLALIENLYHFEPAIVSYLLRPQRAHPLTAAGGLRRFLDGGLDEVDVRIALPAGQSIGPGHVAESLEQLLLRAGGHSVHPSVAEQVQAAHAALSSYLGQSRPRWVPAT